jgi:hypothetical protein
MPISEPENTPERNTISARAHSGSTNVTGAPPASARRAR